MQFLNSLLLISGYVLFIISFILQCQVHCDKEVTDSDLCFDENFCGNDKICYFAYANDADPECMAGWSDNKAVKFHEGVLRNYRKTEVPNSRVTLRLGELYTLDEENGKNVEGMTYFFSKESFKSTYASEYMWDQNDIQILKLAHFTIEIKMDGKKKYIKCNAFVAIPYTYDGK